MGRPSKDIRNDDVEMGSTLDMTENLQKAIENPLHRANDMIHDNISLIYQRQRKLTRIKNVMLFTFNSVSNVAGIDGSFRMLLFRYDITCSRLLNNQIGLKALILLFFLSNFSTFNLYLTEF